MSLYNIFSKEILTEEERKSEFKYETEQFCFVTSFDLSQSIKVTRKTTFQKEFTYEKYSNNLLEFIGYWNTFIHPRLNGFNGFKNLKFEFVDFTLIP